MFWQEKTPDKPYTVPDEIVDLAFKVDCKCLPLEHAHALSGALREALPWLEDESRAGIHLIHGAESGNGWMRPEDPQNELLYLSRRTRMTLRLPKERLEDAGQLVGEQLDIEGYSLIVGESVVKPLSTSGTIFSRYVISDESESEEDFLSRIYKDLQRMSVEVNKLMCGKTHILQGPEGKILTRSIMLAELKAEDSVKVQQKGIGPGRKYGCGLFIAHKGIAPVNQSEE